VVISDFITKIFRANVNSVTTSVRISRPFEPDGLGQPPRPYQTSALWDTGSSHCLITKSLAQSLDLRPVRQARVMHHDGVTFFDVYFAALYVTRKYYVEVALTETGAPSDNFELIIGMDVISKGDFALTNQKDVMVFSFRLPSSTTIDFGKNP